VDVGLVDGHRDRGDMGLCPSLAVSSKMCVIDVWLLRLPLVPVRKLAGVNCLRSLHLLHSLLKLRL